MRLYCKETELKIAQIKARTQCEYYDLYPAGHGVMWDSHKMERDRAIAALDLNTANYAEIEKAFGPVWLHLFYKDPVCDECGLNTSVVIKLGDNINDDVGNEGKQICLDCVGKARHLLEDYYATQKT